MLKCPWKQTRKAKMTDASVIIDIWTSMKEYIPAKDRISAAEHFLTTVSEAGLVDVEVDHRELFGSCKDLDRAVQEVAVDLDLCEDVDDYNNEWDE